MCLPVPLFQQGRPPLIVPEAHVFFPTVGLYAPDSPWFRPVGCGFESRHPPNGPGTFHVAPRAVLGQAEQGQGAQGGTNHFRDVRKLAWEQHGEVSLGTLHGSPMGSGGPSCPQWPEKSSPAASFPCRRSPTESCMYLGFGFGFYLHK